MLQSGAAEGGEARQSDGTVKSERVAWGSGRTALTV